MEDTYAVGEKERHTGRPLRDNASERLTLSVFAFGKSTSPRGRGKRFLCGYSLPFTLTVRRDCALRIANCALQFDFSLFTFTCVFAIILEE